MKDQNKLFDADFQPADREEWTKVLEKELRGKDPATVRWSPVEGMELEPIYFASEIPANPEIEEYDGYIKKGGWMNLPYCEVTASHELPGGANGIAVKLEGSQDVQDWISKTDYVALLVEKGPVQAPGRGHVLFPSPAMTLDYTEEFHKIGGYGFLVPFPDTRETINRIAMSLGLIVEILNRGTDAGKSLEEIIRPLVVGYTATGSYFLDIASVRTLKLLFQRVAKAYGFSGFLDLKIHGFTNPFTMSEEELNYNIVRATTQAMSMIIAGAEVLTIFPHNHKKDADDFSFRIAANVSSILSEESYLDRVSNPVSGSFYIQYLTEKLMELSWETFLAIEETGGITEYLSNTSWNETRF